MEYEAVINSVNSKIINSAGNEIKVDGTNYLINHVKLADGRIHLMVNNTNYTISPISVDFEKKLFAFELKGKMYHVRLKDPFDKQLESMGFQKNNHNNKISSIKAPMPGLVVKVLVSENQEIKTGDNMLILKAMKMENVIKSPSNSIVKKILVNDSEAVEKDQELIIL